MTRSWGFIGSHGREGLSRVTDITLRPVLFTGMFVVSLGLYYLSSDILIVLTSEALGANKSIPTAGMFFSLAGAIGSSLVHAMVLWRALHFSFEILHMGTYWAMKVPGIEAGRPGKPCHGDGRAERPPFPANCFFGLRAAHASQPRRKRRSGVNGQLEA